MRRPDGLMLVLAVLPMANILVMGLLVGYRRPDRRPLLPGFEAFGLISMAFFSIPAAWFRYEAMEPYLRIFLGPVADHIGREQPIYPTIACSVAAVVLGAPQLAFALLGGFLCRGLKIVIPRRQAITPAA